MRTHTWGARRSLYDDGRAYRGQPLRVRGLRPGHESARNCERALPIQFGLLQGLIPPITGRAADKLLPFTCTLAQSTEQSLEFHTRKQFFFSTSDYKWNFLLHGLRESS